MAVRFDALADYYIRTADLVNHNAAYTAMMWVYISVDLNDWGHFYCPNTDPTDDVWQNADWLGLNNDGTTLRVGGAIAGTSASTLGTNLVVGTWYHITMVRESVTTLRSYLNGVLDATATLDITGRLATAAIWISRLNDFQYNGRMAAIKEYSVALTAEEIARERPFYMPVRSANLVAWSPILPGPVERLANHHGGTNWTGNGTLTDEEGPPISWRANTRRRWNTLSAGGFLNRNYWWGNY